MDRTTRWAKRCLDARKGNAALFGIFQGGVDTRLRKKHLKEIAALPFDGIAIGGLMHGYIPEGFFENYMDKGNLFAVPIATILAVPMYSNASGILPVGI